MDPSYKIRNFFVKTSKAFEKLKQKEELKKQEKLVIIKEINDDLFYLEETAKKKHKDKKITKEQYSDIIKKSKLIKSELKKIKKELINP